MVEKENVKNIQLYVIILTIFRGDVNEVFIKYNCYGNIPNTNIYNS